MHDPPRLADDVRTALLDTARQSIRYGLECGSAPALDLEGMPTGCREPGAAFVTLEIRGTLRGCIGSLEARRPLATDVSAHAFDAAFRDPRFPPLETRETTDLDVRISVLTPPVPLPVASEAELLHRVRPGQDGLILEDHGHRGTFLPAVWEDLPDPRAFIAHLKRKAGLPADYWSDSIQFRRYTVEAFGGRYSG